MQILQPTCNYSYKNNRHTVFGSTGRCVFGKDKQIICNYTKFFREDLNWLDFVKIIKQKYKNASNVNVLNLACSDGSEPISLMTLLLHELKEDSKKFFPILAMDIDGKIISDAQSGLYRINREDKFRTDMFLKNHAEYFSLHNTPNKNFPYVFELLSAYKKNIIFKQQDLVYSINNLQPENNLILCRNVLPYLTDFKKERFVDKLSEKLDSSSLLVLGSYDIGRNIDSLVRSRGFKPYEMAYVYCKC